MGGNWFGLAVYGGDPSDIAARITAWMRQRGLERQDGPPPPRLHASKERGARIWRAERAVTVAFSELGELQRLHFELRKAGLPTLLAYQHDSSMIGYEAWRDGRAVSAWSSEPDDPEVPAPDDLAALAAATGADPAAVERIRRKRSVFAESVAGPLFAALGAATLAGTWDDPHAAPHDVLWFREQGFDPWAGFDLMAARFAASTAPIPAPTQPAAPYRPPLWVLPLRLLLAPLGWLLRLVTWLRGGRPPLAPPMPWTLDGRTLRNPAAGATWILPDGAEPVPWPFLRPVDVFVLRWEGATVMLTESAPDEMRASPVIAPHGAEIVDRPVTVAGSPARLVGFRLAGAPAWTVHVWIHPPGRLLVARATGQGAPPDGVHERFEALLGGLSLAANVSRPADPPGR